MRLTVARTPRGRRSRRREVELLIARSRPAGRLERDHRRPKEASQAWPNPRKITRGFPPADGISEALFELRLEADPAPVGRARDAAISQLDDRSTGSCAARRPRMAPPGWPGGSPARDVEDRPAVRAPRGKFASGARRRAAPPSDGIDPEIASVRAHIAAEVPPILMRPVFEERVEMKATGCRREKRRAECPDRVVA